MNKVIKFIFFVFSPILLAGIIGLIINTDTYLLLNKPSLSPNGVLFPIIWSILYLLMGISFYIISYDKYPKRVQIIYYLQLLVNLIWPFLFFMQNLYLVSAIWILLLIMLVINMIIEFYNINKIAGILNIPYLFWLIFAFYLNLGIYILN